MQPSHAGPQETAGRLDEAQEDMLRVGTALRNIGWLRHEAAAASRPLISARCCVLVPFLAGVLCARHRYSCPHRSLPLCSTPAAASGVS